MTNDYNMYITNNETRTFYNTQSCAKSIILDFATSTWSSTSDNNLIPKEYRGSSYGFGATLNYGLGKWSLSGRGGWGSGGCGRYENESGGWYGCACACTFQVPTIVEKITWEKYVSWGAYGSSAGAYSPREVCVCAFTEPNLEGIVLVGTSTDSSIRSMSGFPSYPIYGVAMRHMTRGNSRGDKVGFKNAHLVGRKLVDNSRPTTGSCIENIPTRII